MNYRQAHLNFDVNGWDTKKEPVHPIWDKRAKRYYLIEVVVLTTFANVEYHS